MFLTFVRVSEKESFESVLKRFKKKVDKDGIIQDYKKHQYFEKPSDTKRRKKMEAKRKAAQKKSKRKK